MLPSMPLLFVCPQEQMSDENGQMISKGISQDSLKPIEQIESTRSSSRSVVGHLKVSKSSLSEGSQTLLPSNKDGNAPLIFDRHPKQTKYARDPVPRKKRKIDSSKKTVKLVDPSKKENTLAESYFMKVKHTLNEQEFIKFISILGDFNVATETFSDLLKQLFDLLKGYPNVFQEFVGFLLPHQALKCEKFMESLYFEKCRSFFRNIDANHLNRLVHSLEQLLNQKLSLELIRNSLYSIFKGHSHLIDGFLQLIPLEKPASSNSLVDYEEIKDYCGNDSDWEVIRVIVHPDRGCGNYCCCPCHEKSPHILCIHCNIKFSNGHVYVQHGKALRFARVKFDELDSEEILKNLNPTLYNKPNGTAEATHSNKGLINSADEPLSTGEIDRAIESVSVSSYDTVKDVMVKQEFEELRYFDVGEFSVIEIDEEDYECEDDDKLSETSSGEGDKSIDSGVGDFIFDDVGCNEDEDDYDYDDDSLKELNLNESSKAELANEKEKNDTRNYDHFIKDLNYSFGLPIYNDFELKFNQNNFKIPEFSRIGQPNTQRNHSSDTTTSCHIKQNDVSINFDSKNLENKVCQSSCSPNMISVKGNFLKKSCETIFETRKLEESHGNIVESKSLKSASSEVLAPVHNLSLKELHAPLLSDVKFITSTIDEDNIGAKNVAAAENEKKNRDGCGLSSVEMHDRLKSEWTRAEDKIILEAFQKELDTEHTFSKISCNMPTRTVAEIQGRFQVLMKLLEQVASGTHDSNPS